MKYRTLAALAAVGMIASTAAVAHHGEADGIYRAGDMQVHHVWTRANSATAHAGAAYMTLTNNGSETDRLVGAETSAAANVSFEAYAVSEDGTAGIQDVAAIGIEPGQSITLQPGGMQLKLDGLTQQYAEGDHYHLHLEFERAGSLEVEVQVESVDATEPSDQISMLMAQ